MAPRILDFKQIKNEVVIKPVRSSGPGGQHVNKVATKIDLRFNIPESQGLDEAEKTRILKKLASRLNADGVLIIQAAETRSQFRNRQIALARLKSMLEESLKRPKKRKPTKPSKSSVEKRLKSKKRQAEKKQSRKNPGLQ